MKHRAALQFGFLCIALVLLSNFLEVDYNLSAEYFNGTTAALNQPHNVTLQVQSQDDEVVANDPLTNSTTQTCQEKVQALLLTADPGSINQHRRLLALQNPTCYHSTISHFISHYQTRLASTLPHFHLHIPKAGGTSLCDLAKRHKHTTSKMYHDRKHNCWEKKYFYPAWCYSNFQKRKSVFTDDDRSCDVYMVGKRFPEFVMNENYLDHPLCMNQRIYSISIREPVSRTMSNEAHLYQFRSKSTERQFNQRMELVRRDYITWALSADYANNSSTDKFHIVPTENELEIAKDTLSKFDFIIDIAKKNETCTNTILELMGFGTDRIGHSRASKGGDNTGKLQERGEYEVWNVLDSKLYEFAEQWMDADCEFHLRVLVAMKQSLLSDPAAPSSQVSGPTTDQAAPSTDQSWPPTSEASTDQPSSESAAPSSEVSRPSIDQAVPFSHQSWRYWQTSESATSSSQSSHTIAPYNLTDILNSYDAFVVTTFILLYNPSNDTFQLISDGNPTGKSRIDIALVNAPIIVRALRFNFPDRFPSENEFLAVMSVTDSPRLKGRYFGRNAAAATTTSTASYAPVLHFGSVFRNESLVPMLMQPMPPPISLHAKCFDSWQNNLFTKGTKEVCEQLLSVQDMSNLTAKERHKVMVKIVDPKFGLYINESKSWDDLIPQLIWRGSDYSFLGNRNRPNANLIQKRVSFLEGGAKTLAAIQAWEDLGDEIPPRWKGVLLTNKAEKGIALESKQLNASESKLPWVNIKFHSPREGAGIYTQAQFLELEKVGISALGDFISMQSHSEYKYHIDLGGGGGTTWTGTLEKLAMPGVLFHHETPTWDYFYDKLEPMVHYIPVRTDLEDLKEKFHWAESHPEEAKQISKRATELLKWMGSVDGFEAMYEEYMVGPLRKFVDSYVPLNRNTSVLEYLNEITRPGRFKVRATYSGLGEKMKYKA